MNRRNFTRTWGRKVFFGMAWPLFALLGLLYFPGQVYPNNLIDALYLLFTFLGHYGLITSALYFILYVPAVTLIPTYYFSRIWSLLLILLTSVALTLDAGIFYTYQTHINSYFLEFLALGKVQEVFAYSQIVYLIIGGLLLLTALVIWVRGEGIWRGMQRRFSNPVSNWYLYLIVLSALVGHGMFVWGYLNGGGTLVQMSKPFPLHWPVPVSLMEFAGISTPEKISTHKLFYPKKAMKCPGDNNLNVLFIITGPGVQGEAMNHYVEHGLHFTDHYAGGITPQDGIFSLLYSLPATYLPETLAGKIRPVFIEELQRKNYHFNVLTGPGTLSSELQELIFQKRTESENVSENWFKWLSENEEGTMQPFFGMLYFNENVAPGIIDEQVSQIIEDLQKRKLLENTVILITAAHGGSDALVPLLALWPDRSRMEVNTFTTHYDIVPSLMKDLWNCTNRLTDYSFRGTSLFFARKRDWHLLGSPGNFKIIDYHNQLNKVSRKKIELLVLRELTRFRKK